MPKYLVEANYRTSGISGLLKEGGTGRRAAVNEMFNSLGGKVESFYFSFGEEDVYIIGELPDNAAAAALTVRVDSTGAATCKTFMLMTPEEIDVAVKKTGTYRPPGYQIEAEVSKWEGEGGHLAGGEAGNE
ncbi:GYD domain-containing protein [Massilia horti]|nr:GYD domain-containing protein [Massilia horti]